MVRSLCQGTPDEQRRTIDRYFTPDAEFVHPFCVAPRFGQGDIAVPGLRRLSSRDALRGIFQWYRMLSPRIVIDIDTACKCRQPAFPHPRGAGELNSRVGNFWSDKGFAGVVF